MIMTIITAITIVKKYMEKARQMKGTLSTTKVDNKTNDEKLHQQKNINNNLGAVSITEVDNETNEEKQQQQQQTHKQQLRDFIEDENG